MHVCAQLSPFHKAICHIRLEPTSITYICNELYFQIRLQYKVLRIKMLTYKQGMVAQASEPSTLAEENCLEFEVILGYIVRTCL